jgi:hypothetical protein
MKVQDISSKNRIRKYNLFLQEIKPSVEDKILDVGFANIEYSEVDNFLEKNYPYSSNITALGVEIYDLFAKRYPDIHVIQYDGKKFPFEEQIFDIGWSNAVIEQWEKKSIKFYFYRNYAEHVKGFILQLRIAIFRLNCIQDIR